MGIDIKLDKIFLINLFDRFVKNSWITGIDVMLNLLSQNKPEIDEIPATEHLESVILPAAERAIYLELDHHLRALDMTIKRGRKNESDREKRLQKSLGESK